jgi:TIR domain
MNRSQRIITLVISLGTVLVALIAARSDPWFHGALAAVLTAAAAAFSWRWGSSLRAFWGLAGLATALAGASIFLGAHRMERRCTARYLDRRVVIGTELTPAARVFVEAEGQWTNDSLLFDAAGQPELVWTGESIQRCGQWLLALGSLWVPLFGLSLVCAVTVAGSRFHLGASAAPVPPGAPGELHYDAFISYRRGTDAEFARHLVEELEAAGYRVAIDERDFRPEQSFLQEMERCIRSSRFTVALISRGFLASGNTEVEALIAKVLDMGERKRRLLPLLLEKVETPVWMYDIVGIDFTAEGGLVAPLDKLKAALGKPLTDRKF